MLTYADLQHKPSALLAATSLTAVEFDALHCAFVAAYNILYPPHQTLRGQARKRQSGAGVKGTLACSADKLLFILIYHKTNPLQTMHGLQFGLSQPQANYWIQRLLPVLQRALADLHQTPERHGAAVAHSELVREGGPDLVREGGPDLLLDGTERRRQRPQDRTRQRDHYSGKKKAHTDKNLLLVNDHTGQVVYLGETLPGKVHDKKAADAAHLSFPPGTTLAKDSGFQGYEPAGAITLQPKKSRVVKP